MSCGLCRSTRANPACPVCRDEEPITETADHDGGSLLQTMHAETARTISATVFVASVVAMILMAAAGCHSFEAYTSAVIVAIMAAFVGSTQDA